MLDIWIKDVALACRGLRRNPGFTAVAVAMLAAGIGVNAAVFAVTNAVLFKGFPLIDGNDRLLYVGTEKDGRECCVSYPDFVDWRAQATSFEDLGAVADLRVTLNDGNGFPESHIATRITANAFRLLGQRPIVGRDFSPEDETVGAPAVAVLTHGLWTRRYGGDPAVVGRTVRLNGTPTTVIGVMAEGFRFPQNQELWVPLVPTPELQRRDARTLWFAFGRMTPGASRTSVTTELEMIGRRLDAAYPDTNRGWVPRPRSFGEFFVGRNAAVMYGTLWGAVGFVMLIACANLANLTLARAAGRTREMAVRMALGAGRSAIVRQLLVESVILSALGGVFGGWLARWGVRVYALTANPPTRAWSDQLFDFTMDASVAAYLVAIAAAAGLLFGLAPAWRLSRADSGALKEGSRGAVGAARGRRLSALLVTAELALAVVLLAGAGVMVRSFLNVHTADIGVDRSNSVTLFLNLPDRYDGDEAQISFYDRLAERFAAIPGIESVAMASALPAGGARRVAYEVAGAPVAGERTPTVSAVIVGPDYFRTVHAPVLAGREFTGIDRASGAPAAVVNQQFVRMHWPGEEPVGKRLRLVAEGTAPSPWLTVVGVVSNVVQDVTRQSTEPLVYLPYRQRPAGNMWIIARTAAAPGALASAFRREVAAIDPDLPIGTGPFTLDERLAGMGNYWLNGSHAALLLIVGAIALLLASLGLYAVVAHAVSQRTQEIGLRIAIWRLVTGHRDAGVTASHGSRGNRSRHRAGGIRGREPPARVGARRGGADGSADAGPRRGGAGLLGGARVLGPGAPRHAHRSGRRPRRSIGSINRVGQ